MSGSTGRPKSTAHSDPERPKEAAKRRSLTEFLRFPKDSLPLADDTEEDAFSERAWKDRLLRILVGTNSLRLAPLFSLGFRSSPKSTVKDSAGLLLVSAAARPPASPSRSAERSRAESAGDRTRLSLEREEVRLLAGVALLSRPDGGLSRSGVAAW